MAAAATMAAAARELMLRAGASDMEEEEGPLGGGPGLQEPLQLGELDISSDEFILDEVDVHIQANLEDELVKEALKTVRLSAILICPSAYPPLKEEKKETVSLL